MDKKIKYVKRDYECKCGFKRSIELDAEIFKEVVIACPKCGKALEWKKG